MTNLERLRKQFDASLVLLSYIEEADKPITYEMIMERIFQVRLATSGQEPETELAVKFLLAAGVLLRDNASMHLVQRKVAAACRIALKIQDD